MCIVFVTHSGILSFFSCAHSPFVSLFRNILANMSSTSADWIKAFDAMALRTPALASSTSALTLSLPGLTVLSSVSDTSGKYRGGCQTGALVFC